MSSSLSLYLKDVSKGSLLSREEEVCLSQKIEKGDQAARDEMVESNLRLAISIAKKYHRRGLNLEDLIQESNIGLMKAVDRFDWRRGFKFSTYASWWIRQSVMRHISSHSSTIKVPAHASSLSWKAWKLSEEFENEFGCKPTLDEVADILGVSKSILKSSIESFKLKNTISMSVPFGDDDDRTLEESIPDESYSDPGVAIDKVRITKAINTCVKKLSSREEKIIRLRFGIFENNEEEGHDLSQSEIDMIMGGQEL